MRYGLKIGPFTVVQPETRLSDDAIALYHAYRDMVDAGETTRTTDVFDRANLKYDQGRAALRELEAVGTVKEFGNLG